MERFAWWLVVLLIVASPSRTGVCFAEEEPSEVSMEASEPAGTGEDGEGGTTVPVQEAWESPGEEQTDPASHDPAVEPAAEGEEADETAEEAAGKSYVCPQCSFTLDSPGDCPSCNIALVEQSNEPADAPVKKRYSSEPPRGAGNSVTFTNQS
ncbi:MAG: hypothetical protein GX442_09870 [Candidatus Riflebacteria bacterium]|nr:hypothetical protein [Candidatus Riflebacteria bacterium]